MADHKLKNVNVNLNDVPNERCVCGHFAWKVVFLLKKISALVSPSGKETIVPIQIFACDKCGKFSPLFNNLNDTDELPDSSGEPLGASTENNTPPQDTNKLFIS